MQQGDYSYYQQPPPPSVNPNPNPNSTATDPNYNQSASYASAPPFSSNYDYSSVHPSYPHHTTIDQAPARTTSGPSTQPNYLQQPAPQPAFNQPPSQPVFNPPPASQPAFNQSPTSQPVFNQPQSSQPLYNQPHAQQTVFNQPLTPQTSYNQPPSSQPSFNQPQTLPGSFPPYDPHAVSYQQLAPSLNYLSPFDQNQIASNQVPASGFGPPAVANPSHATSIKPPYSSMYAPNYESIGSSSTGLGPYDSLFDNSTKYDSGTGYIEDKYGKGGAGMYTRSQSDSGSSLNRRQESTRYEDLYGDGVYRYEGGKTEPYGSRGSAPKSSNWSGFDDFGRSISIPSGSEKSSSGKIVRANPKIETQQDVKGGVQKFRVKLLAEGAGSNMDVLCQIGLDGIRMLDPSSNRTLRIYPLENVTRCDKLDSSTFAFWSKSAVDNEPRRIRLQSSSYTVNTLLDTVTAATVQFKEMGGGIRPADSVKNVEQTAEKKKGIVDWMNMIKPGNEEKDHWVPDEAVSKCTGCGTDFSAFVRKHHCRNCGDIFCDKCTHGRIALTAEQNAQQVRVCDRCMAEVTQRLSNAKDATKSTALPSHEDLARKLQDEMEKNRKSSSGTKSDTPGRRMKEVECPTCTVHLQVQVPISGSETIECGVCQHPFLVSAH